MAFDLQSDGWPDDDKARDDYQAIRARIISGLVRLAGSEAVPQGAVKDPSQELSDEGRFRLLDETLGDGASALDAYAALIALKPPAVPAALGGVAELAATVAEAKAAVAAGAAVLANVQWQYGAINEKDGDALKGVPKQVHPPLSKLIDRWSPVRKIFVAVHGIGDQFKSETVQSVAYRVCDYVGVPTALPLGRFHGPGGTVRIFVPEPALDPPLNCGFAEIYWADVPRVPAAEKHTLEEPRKWARTLVERLRLRGKGPLVDRRGREDDERLEQLLEEMIDGVNVADRLTYLAEKAGLFSFDLADLLNDYINDVQVVTEFEDYRRQLLDIFDNVLSKIHRYFTASEIYIVAHSEGTVVSYLGLIKGISENAANPEIAPWARSVRGYMTIGSPLNKHVRFWPELFKRYTAPAADPTFPPIPWKNYYDFGDPIGYDLTPTRAWMKESGWDRFFVFRGERNLDDIGFTRYYFPGAAHNDYWHDEHVFGHFIEEVVDRTNTVLPRDQKTRYGVPGTHLLAALTSYPMPYLLSALLLFVATFILYKAVRACLDPVGARFESPPTVLLNILGLSGLIAGMSLLARIPRLARGLRWRVLAFVLAAVLSSAYFLASPGNRGSIEAFLTRSDTLDPYLNGLNLGLIGAAVGGALLLLVKGLRPLVLTLLPVVVAILLIRCVSAPLSVLGPHSVSWVPWPSLAVIAVALLIGYRAWRVSWLYPSIGTKPLIHTGGLVILLVVASEFAFHRPRLSPAELAAVEAGLQIADQVAIARAVTDEVQEAACRVVEVYHDREPASPEGGQKSDPDSARRKVRDASSMQVVTEAAFNQGQLWPVFLAGAAFLYLWWLAVVLFDLTFVWHVYIRWSGAQKFVDDWLKPAEAPDQAPGPAPGEPGATVTA